MASCKKNVEALWDKPKRENRATGRLQPLELRGCEVQSGVIVYTLGEIREDEIW